MIEVKNAIITSATLSSEDHGCLSGWVYLDFGNTGQGFGGYALYIPDRPDQKNYAGHFIWRVMEIANVTTWEDLKGKTVRVKGDRGNIEAIGHILKDIWFNPSEEFKAMEGNDNE